MTSNLRTTVMAIILALALAIGDANAQTIGIKKDARNTAAKNADPVQPAGSATAVTGSGSAGQITRWTSPNTIGDSIITEGKQCTWV